MRALPAAGLADARTGTAPAPVPLLVSKSAAATAPAAAPGISRARLCMVAYGGCLRVMAESVGRSALGWVGPRLDSRCIRQARERAGRREDEADLGDQQRAAGDAEQGVQPAAVRAVPDGVQADRDHECGGRCAPLPCPAGS